ncbi:MAG: hypothetical protein ACR2NZ_09310 [Rubripirellula sp.]
MITAGLVVPTRHHQDRRRTNVIANVMEVLRIAIDHDNHLTVIT